MRLDELISVKKYKNRPLQDVIADFRNVGGKVLGSGKYSTVIWHPSWKYVFKFFSVDNTYLQFIRFVKRHQNISAFPKILGGPWKTFHSIVAV